MSENVTAAKAAKAPAATFGGRGLTIGIAAAAAVTVIGLVLWGMQLAGGFMDTAMRDFAPWGINIALFMFFVGLSVGSMVVASSPCALGFEGFGGIAKMAAWVSICSTVLAIGFVVVDLGQPLRLWELFAYSNLSSPLMWDIIVLSVYLILSVVYLWTLLRTEKRQASAKALRIVSAVVLLWALVVCAVDGWIFGLMPSRALWNTALLAPWFVSSALASGTALVLVLAIVLRRAGYVDVREEHVARLAKLLGAFVCVDLFFFACDLVTEGFPGGSGASIVGMLVAGQLAPFFWIQIVGCALAAVVCFVPKLRTSPLLVAAGLLTVAGVFCKRMQLVVGGFQVPSLDYATFVTPFTVTSDWGVGLAGAYEGMIYAPTLPEVGLALGVLSLGVLLVLVGLKFLPLSSVQGAN